MSMRFSHIGRVIAGLVIAATVAACGGGGGGGPSGSDPTATVKDMIATVTAGDYDKLADFACAAQKDEITQQFDPSSLLGGDAGALGLSAADLKQVITFTVSGLEVKEKSKDATTAVVSMTGKMKININKDKFTELMKKALEAAGQPADDATLNLAMGMFDSFAGEEQDISSDVSLVNEGGKWLICD